MSGHDPAGPASHWDRPKVPHWLQKAAEHRRDEPEDGEISDEDAKIILDTAMNHPYVHAAPILVCFHAHK